MNKRTIYDTKILKILGIFVSGLAVLLVLLLAAEYRALNQTAQTVLELKEDYRSYVMALKRAIKEKTREVSKDEKNDVKKNSISDGLNQEEVVFLCAAGVVDSECPQDTFLVVNREPHHLRAGALEHAKRYNLDQVLAKMFDTKEWPRVAAQKKAEFKT